jgi:sulfur-carrier protein
MIDAATEARRRSLDHTCVKVTVGGASERPSADVCARPSSVAMSAVPCQRRFAFHALWPCRTSRTPVADIPADARAGGTLGFVAIVRLFASAREAARTGRDELPGATVSEVLEAAGGRYGSGFKAVLATCRVWVNGETADPETPVGPYDEVAILPPVSGG